MPISLSVRLSSPLLPDNLVKAAMCGMLHPTGIWKSCYEMTDTLQSSREHVLFMLLLDKSVSVSYLCCTNHALIKPSFVFCLPPSSLPSLSHISSASIPFFACELKAVTPYRRGFFCGDSSITYPNKDKEVISDSVLIIGGIAITGITVRKRLLFLFTVQLRFITYVNQCLLSFFLPRSRWLNATGCVSEACTRELLFETSMCRACTRSWEASCLAAVWVSLSRIWPS